MCTASPERMRFVFVCTHVSWASAAFAVARQAAAKINVLFMKRSFVSDDLFQSGTASTGWDGGWDFQVQPAVAGRPRDREGRRLRLGVLLRKLHRRAGGFECATVFA